MGGGSGCQPGEREREKTSEAVSQKIKSEKWKKKKEEK